jgi:hypothetical protein
MFIYWYAISNKWLFQERYTNVISKLWKLCRISKFQFMIFYFFWIPEQVFECLLLTLDHAKHILNHWRASKKKKVDHYQITKLAITEYYRITELQNRTSLSADINRQISITNWLCLIFHLVWEKTLSAKMFSLPS